MKTSTDPTQPNYIRPEVAEMLPMLTTFDDVLCGTPRIHARAATYLRKWKHEDPDVYAIRSVCEPVFEGLSRTLGAAVGMLFTKPPVMEWNSSESALAAILDNADMAGTKYTVLAKRYAELAMGHGLAIGLVDYTPRPRDAQGKELESNAANDQSMRPKWSLYTRASAICWNDEAVNNHQKLTQLTLAEEARVVKAGEFGPSIAQRFRDLRLMIGTDGKMQAMYIVRELVQSNVASGKDEFRVIESGAFRNRNGKAADFLPVAIAYAGRKLGTMQSTLPFAGTCFANLSYWRYATNLTFNREVCGFEQMTIVGDLQPGPGHTAAKPVAGQIQIGPLKALHLKMGGSAAWIGPSGKGLEQLERGKHEKMVEMDQQGLGFLVPGKSAQMSATEAAIDNHGKLATLGTAGVGINDGLNLLLEITAWYEGIEKVDAPVMTINTKFDARVLDATSAGAFSAMVRDNTLTLATFLQLLIDGGVLPEGFNVGREVEALALNAPPLSLVDPAPSVAATPR